MAMCMCAAISCTCVLGTLVLPGVGSSCSLAQWVSNQSSLRVGISKDLFFFNFWLVRVFAAACGFSRVADSRGHSSLQWPGFSWQCFSRGRAQALGRRVSAAAMHRFRCPAACEILPDQGTNPHPLHWQVDS